MFQTHKYPITFLLQIFWNQIAQQGTQAPYNLAPPLTHPVQSCLPLLLDMVNSEDNPFFKALVHALFSVFVLEGPNQMCPLICEVLPVPIPCPRGMTRSLS